MFRFERSWVQWGLLLHPTPPTPETKKNRNFHAMLIAPYTGWSCEQCVCGGGGAEAGSRCKHEH
jgi:hypothetical protein